MSRLNSDFTRCANDGDCDENALCNLGVCHCLPGYHGDGDRVCADIDECWLRYCDVNADCTNTNGSYSCRCKHGYRDEGEGRQGESCVGECTLRNINPTRQKKFV